MNGSVKGGVKEPDAGPVAYAVKWESATACSTSAVQELAMNKAQKLNWQKVRVSKFTEPPQTSKGS